MAGENQKELSKKLDTKVKQMEIGDTLGNIIVTSKRLRDQLNKNLQESEKSLADQLKQQQLYNQQSFQTFDPWLNLK